MGHSQVARAYQELRLENDFVPHHRLLADRWTGVLHVRWRIPRDHPLVVAAGWYSLRGGEPTPDRPSNGLPRRVAPRRAPAPPEVVAEIVRKGAEGTPVVPGSSLKGAVRQVYEVLTPSCLPWAPIGCNAAPRDIQPRLCPACSLFGARGVGGRAAFAEACPANGDWRPRLALRRVPAAWKPQKGEKETVRTYDLAKARNPDGRPAPDAVSVWTVWGDFDSTIRLVNASDDELGLLFAALGIGGQSPMVRLGGKKYDGFGAADVELLRTSRSYPQRASLDAAGAATWAADHARRALDAAEPRRLAWESLHAVMSRA